jgi:hypothetical protein
METEKKTKFIQEAFRKIKLIFTFLLLGQMAFLTLVVFLNADKQSVVFGENSLTFIFVALGLTSMAIVQFFLFRKKINSIQKLETIELKIQQYQTAFIILLAPIEGSVLFSVVAYMLETDLVFIGFAVALLLLFLAQRPTPKKFADDLGLSKEEQRELK